jgi:hypothetical protein
VQVGPERKPPEYYIDDLNALCAAIGPQPGFSAHVVHVPAEASAEVARLVRQRQRYGPAVAGGVRSAIATGQLYSLARPHVLWESRIAV